MQDELIQKAVEILKNGGVIAHPTDTCYGLACSIFSKKGLGKLYGLKKMPFSKPVSILVSSLNEAKKYGQWNPLAEKLAKKYWPGPLTVILKRETVLPLFLNPESKTVGIRFPKHKFSREIIKKLGCPIATTSANITGATEPYKISDLVLSGNPDLIIDAGELPKISPSTVVDVSEGKLQILREGPIVIF